MSQRGKRGNRLENDNIQQPPIKRRKGRPPNCSIVGGGGGGGSSSLSTTATNNNNFDGGNDHHHHHHRQHIHHHHDQILSCLPGSNPTGISSAAAPVVSANYAAGTSNTISNGANNSGSSSVSAPWQARSIADLKISSIYNRSSNEAPAELFRKDLISAMKLPDSEPLSTDEYWTITDQWKQEWEKGVQVPVNPDSLPEPSVKSCQESIVTVKHDFKLPKNKYVRITKDDNFSSELHYLSNVTTLAEAVCAYDLDQTDEVWLKLINNERILSGADPITAGQFERVIEELEVRCWDKIQAIMKNEEGLGIEYDENVICDVCRSPDSEEANEMVFCDNCNICVHQACYGITTIPSGQWLCRTCSMGKKPECVLCPNKGGAMKSTKSGKKWAHVSCALWIPEVSIGCVDRMEPITKISSIPQSRWALICVLCRERVGACIQCSVKTCKTAYHVTCAFQHGLEMRAIIEEGNAEDGVKLRSYCLKHSVSKGKKDNKSTSNNGLCSETDDDDCRRRKRKDMTTEERNQARAQRLQEVEAEFDKHVNIKDISCHLLEVDQDAIVYIYNYWILKRKQRFNRALIPPKNDDVEILSSQEEEDTEKRKMVVHLRQDLERVRNLCYMVNRREKLSRSFFKMREQIFYKQIAILSEPNSNINSETRSITDESFISAVVHANNGSSVYDKYYSSSTNLMGDNCTYKLEDIHAKLIGLDTTISNYKNTHNTSNIIGGVNSNDRGATVSGINRIGNNNTNSKSSKYPKMPYKKIHVNGITTKSGRTVDSVYSDSSLSSQSDDHHSLRRVGEQSKYSSSKTNSNNNNTIKKKQSYSRTQHKKRKFLSTEIIFSTSDDDSVDGEDVGNNLKKVSNINNKKTTNTISDNKRNPLLQQMEKEYAKESGGIFSDSSNDSEELITIKQRTLPITDDHYHSTQNKLNKKVPIYSDSEEDDNNNNADNNNSDEQSDNSDGSTDKEKTDNTVSDSQHQMFRTKAAMKEFNLQSANKIKNDTKIIKDSNTSGVTIKPSNKKSNNSAITDLNSSIESKSKSSITTNATKKIDLKEIVERTSSTRNYKKSPSSSSTTKVNKPKSSMTTSFSGDNLNKNSKNFPTDLFVPQRQAAKKASENMRSNNIYSNSAVIQRKDSRDTKIDDKDINEKIQTSIVPSIPTKSNTKIMDKIKEIKDEDDIKVDIVESGSKVEKDKDHHHRERRDKEIDKEKDKDRDKEKSKPRGRPPKLLKDDQKQDMVCATKESISLCPKDNNTKTRTESKHLNSTSDIIPSSRISSTTTTLTTETIEKSTTNNKNKNNILMVAYVPQRQAAKKAAEHIKSGLGKNQTTDQVSTILQSDDKDNKDTRLSTSSSSSSVSSSTGGDIKAIKSNEKITDEKITKKLASSSSLVSKELPREIRTRRKSMNINLNKIEKDNAPAISNRKEQHRKISKSSSSESTSDSDSECSSSSSSTSSSVEEDDNNRIKAQSTTSGNSQKERATISANRRKRQSNSSQNSINAVPTSRRKSDLIEDLPNRKDQQRIKRNDRNQQQQQDELKLEHSETDINNSNKNEDNTLKENTRTNILQNHFDETEDIKKIIQDPDNKLVLDNIDSGCRENFTIPKLSAATIIDISSTYIKKDDRDSNETIINKLNSPKTRNLEEEIAQRKADMQPYTLNFPNKSSKNNFGGLDKLLNKKEKERQKTRDKIEQFDTTKRSITPTTTVALETSIKITPTITTIPDIMDIELSDSNSNNKSLISSENNQTSNKNCVLRNTPPQPTDQPIILLAESTESKWKQNCPPEIIEVVDSSESAQSNNSTKIIDDLKEIQDDDDVRLPIVEQQKTFNPLSHKSVDRDDLYAIDSDNLNFGEEKKSMDSNDIDSIKHFENINNKNIENIEEESEDHQQQSTKVNSIFNSSTDDFIDIQRNIFETTKEEDSARETMNLVEKLRQQKHKRNAGLKSDIVISSPPEQQPQQLQQSTTPTVSNINDTEIQTNYNLDKQQKTTISPTDNDKMQQTHNDENLSNLNSVESQLVPTINTNLTNSIEPQNEENVNNIPDLVTMPPTTCNQENLQSLHSNQIDSVVRNQLPLSYIEQQQLENQDCIQNKSSPAAIINDSVLNICQQSAVTQKEQQQDQQHSDISQQINSTENLSPTTNDKLNDSNKQKNLIDHQHPPMSSHQNDCFDTIATSNFFKNSDFSHIHEAHGKDNSNNTNVNNLVLNNENLRKDQIQQHQQQQQQHHQGPPQQQGLPDCEYDDNTRMQSPYTMHPQNIWNENDLIPNRRSVSTSPSSISESNDANDLKIQQKMINSELPLCNKQSIIEHQQQMQQQPAPPHCNPENVTKNNFSNTINQHFDMASQFHMTSQQQQHMQQQQHLQQQIPPSIMNGADIMSAYNYAQNNQYDSVNMFSGHSQQQQQNLNQMTAFTSPVNTSGMYPQVSQQSMHNNQQQSQNSLTATSMFSGPPTSHHSKHNQQQQQQQNMLTSPPVVMDSTSPYHLGQSSGGNGGAAFTSSSVNMALTAALVSQPIVASMQQQQSQQQQQNYVSMGNMSGVNHISSDSRQLMINSCGVGGPSPDQRASGINQKESSSPTKRSNCSGATAGRQFSQHVKSPQMHRSPGKSPRQMEMLSKQNSNKLKMTTDDRGITTVTKKTRGTRGSGAGRPRGRGRGRGRGIISVSQMPPSMMDFVDNPLVSSIHTNLVGTPYDLDNDEDFGCNVENFKSLRDRRRSLDFRSQNSNIVGGNVQQQNDQQKFSSPTYHNKLRNSVNSRLLGELKAQSTIETNPLTSQSSLLVQPVLPGPVDMRTYNSGFETHNPMSSSQDNYNSHNLLRDFATGTADQTLHEIDEEVEKQFQSALKASGTVKIKPTPPQQPQIAIETIEIEPPTQLSAIVSSVQASVVQAAVVENSMETTSEEISIDSDTTNMKVSLSEPRNQLKLKIKGPLALSGHFNSIQNSTNLNQSITSIGDNLQIQTCNASQTSIISANSVTLTGSVNVNSSGGGTSSIRRMRKKELLRQYWNHDMNQDDSGGLPSGEGNISNLGDSNKIDLPIKPVDSILSTIPTKEDDGIAKSRKKVPGTTRELRQLESKNYDLEQKPERRRSSACSSGSNSDNIKSSNRRRSRSKQLENDGINTCGGSNEISDLVIDEDTPKLKIKIRNNTIETDYPPKKRLSNFAIPSLELLKRDCMNFRKQVMADYDKEEKVKKPAKSKSKKSDKEKKKSKKDKHNDIQVIQKNSLDITSSDSTPKIVLRFGKRKTTSQENQEQSADSSLQLNDTNNKTINSIVPIRLKLARNSEGSGYIIGEKKSTTSTSEAAAVTNNEKSSNDKNSNNNSSSTYNNSNNNNNNSNNNNNNNNKSSSSCSAILNKSDLIDSKKVPVVLLTPTPLPYNASKFVKSAAVANKIRESIKNASATSNISPPILNIDNTTITTLTTVESKIDAAAATTNLNLITSAQIVEPIIKSTITEIPQNICNNSNIDKTIINSSSGSSSNTLTLTTTNSTNSDKPTNCNNSNFLPLNKDCEIR